MHYINGIAVDKVIHSLYNTYFYLLVNVPFYLVWWIDSRYMPYNDRCRGGVNHMDPNVVQWLVTSMSRRDWLRLNVTCGSESTNKLNVGSYFRRCQWVFKIRLNVECWLLYLMIGRKFCPNLYPKDTAGNSLLHFESAHPAHLINSIPKGQYLERKNATVVMRLSNTSSEPTKWFLDRG